MKQPTISIIILNYNGKKYLRGCLDSVFAQSRRDFEIVFVDNGSTDESVGFIQEYYAKEISRGSLRVIANRKNEGFAEGNNIGYRVARGEYAVLLNNDIVAPRQWLANLIAPLDRHKDIHIVGTAYYDKGQYSTWRRILIDDARGSTCNLVGEVLPTTRTTLHEPHLIDAFYVSGNGLALRKRDFRTLFDKDYFAYAEDTYLGWLAKIQGKTAVLNLKATFCHMGGGTKKANPSSFNTAMLTHGHKNQIMNWLIFYEWKNILRTAPIFFVTQIGHVIDNPKKVVVKARAYWWVLTHLQSILAKRRLVQSSRTVRDRDILPHMTGRFFDEDVAAHLYNRSYQRVIKMMNSASIFYCRIVRLPILELKK